MQITIELDSNGRTLFDKRLQRTFAFSGMERKILEDFRQTKDLPEAEKLALKYDLCDCCSFEEMNIDTVRIMIEAIIRTSCRFPKIRSRMCYLGSNAGYLRAMQRLCLIDRQTVKQFGIEGICSDRDIRNLSVAVIQMIDGTDYSDDKSNVLAQRFTVFGLLDAVVFDENDFRGFGYVKLLRGLADSVKTGYHPMGCEEPISVVYHELGHLLDDLYNVSESKDFQTLYFGMTKDFIRKNVSEYASVNMKEFFAECFAEYMCNPRPRETAMKTMRLLESKK